MFKLVTFAFTILFTAQTFAQGICDRSPRVVDRLAKKIKKDCTDISLGDLKGIKSLDLSSKAFEHDNVTLKSGDFAGLVSLTRLALIGLNKEELVLPVDIFDPLSSLVDLNLSVNRLASSDAKIFAKLQNLERLHLNWVGFQEFPKDILSPLVKLRFLSLNRNKIEKIPDMVFSDLPNLREVQAYDNPLKEMAPKALYGLSKLEKISFNGCELTSLPESVFQYSLELKQISLHGNRLANLPEGLFKNLTHLENLFLGGNELETFPVHLFEDQQNLETLMVFQNSINDVPLGVFDSLKRLRRLSLAKNRISEIPKDLFDKTTFLRFLHLEENLIEDIDEDLFSSMELIEVHLENNLLKVFPKAVIPQMTYEAWVGGIYLSDNPIEITPKELYDLTVLDVKKKVYLYGTSLPAKEKAALKKSFGNRIMLD